MFCAINTERKFSYSSVLRSQITGTHSIIFALVRRRNLASKSEAHILSRQQYFSAKYAQDDLTSHGGGGAIPHVHLPTSVHARTQTTRHRVLPSTAALCAPGNHGAKSRGISINRPPRSPSPKECCSCLVDFSSRSRCGLSTFRFSRNSLQFRILPVCTVHTVPHAHRWAVAGTFSGPTGLTTEKAVQT